MSTVTTTGTTALDIKETAAEGFKRLRDRDKTTTEQVSLFLGNILSLGYQFSQLPKTNSYFMTVINKLFKCNQLEICLILFTVMRQKQSV